MLLLLNHLLLNLIIKYSLCYEIIALFPNIHMCTYGFTTVLE